MSSVRHRPLVSVVTPVYNCEAYLAECIDSVLAQTYEHWNYVIINNCSTDRSGEIAERYAQKDSRIRVHHNDRLLNVIQNHNAACRLFASNSTYCKMVHADDWLFPECLERMVVVAEADPTIGIVGAYRIDGTEVGCGGLPYPTPTMSGRALGRLTLLGTVGVFGSANSVLYRADCVRERAPMFDEADFHADTAACLDILRTWNFGFVHQVLTYTRRHPAANTSFAEAINTYKASGLKHLLRYGPEYLTREEYDTRLQHSIAQYYRFLAKSVSEPRAAEVWRYHRAALAEAGCQLGPRKMLRAVLPFWWHALTHPAAAVRLGLRLLRAPA